MKLMGRVFMNEASADGTPAGGATPATPAAAPAAAPATESTTLTPPATPATTDPKPEGGDPAKPAAPAKPEDGKPKETGKDEQQGAPEAYTDFTLPEGIEMDAGTLDTFKGLAKELNIPQAAAQKLIDLQSALAQKQADEYQAAAIKQGQDWAAEVKNDPELGGANYDKSVASAIKVIQSFGDPALTELLNGTGLGNHPALFKFCHRISQAISEDKFVMPGNQASTDRKSNEEVFYGSKP